MPRRELELDLSKLCGALRGPGDYVERMGQIRSRLERGHEGMATAISLAFVGAALRQSLKNIPDRSVDALFHHLTVRGALPEARVLAYRTEVPAKRMGMHERLYDQAEEPIDRRILHELRRQWPSVEPTEVTDPPEMEPSGSLEGWLREVATHPRRAGWKRAIPALLTEEEPRRWADRLREGGHEVAAMVAEDDLHGALGEVLTHRDRTKLAGIYLDAGRKVPAKLRESISPKGDAVALCAAWGVSSLDDLVRALDGMKPRPQEVRLSRYLKAGGAPKALFERRDSFSREALANVWIELILSVDAKTTLKSLFGELLTLVARPPESYYHYVQALRAAMGESSEAGRWSSWLEGERGGSGYARQRERARGRDAEILLRLTNPVALVDAFFEEHAPLLSPGERSALFFAVLRKLAGTAVGYVCLAGRLWLRSDYSNARERQDVALAALFVESLIFQLDDAQKGYMGLVGSLRKSAPRVASQMLVSLPAGKERDALLLGMAFARGGTRLSAKDKEAIKSLDAGLLVASAQSFRRRQWEKSVSSWVDDAARPKSPDQARMWLVLGLALAAEAPTKLVAALSSLKTPDHPGGRRLVAHWRRDAGALSVPFDGDEPCALLSSEREVAMEAFWELCSSEPLARPNEMSVEREIGWFEAKVWAAIDRGERLSPCWQGHLFEGDPTSDDIRRALEGPGLGLRDPSFWKMLAAEAREGEQAAAIADVILEQDPVDPEAYVHFALATDGWGPHLANAVRELPASELARYEDDLVRLAILRQLDDLSEVLGRRSAFLALHLRARLPTTRERRRELAELLERARVELEEASAPDRMAEKIEAAGVEVFWTKETEKSLRRVERDEPNAAKAARDVLRRMILEGQKVGKAKKGVKRLHGIGEEHESYRILYAPLGSDLVLLRFFATDRHADYERHINPKREKSMLDEKRSRLDLHKFFADMA